MKTKILKLVLLISFLFSGCNQSLDEEIYSSLGPSNFYSTAEDAESLLNAVYAQGGAYSNLVRDWLCMGEATTEIFIEREGGINALFNPMEQFTWDAGHSYLLDQWRRWYKAVFNANVVIDKVPAIKMNEDRKEQILAEARFLRALYYTWLYDFWGPVPLLLSSNTTPQDRPVKATDAEFVKFIEDELIAVSQILPITQQQYPRATRGAALGFLTRFHMNNRKWQLAAQSAQDVINLGVYDLFNVGSRADLFKLENEGDNEFIFVVPHTSQNPINTYISHAVPDNYKTTYGPIVNFAADFLAPTAYLNTFDPADERLGGFIFSYESTSGTIITLGTDRVCSFKYPEEINQTGSFTSIDFPLLRYADILLLRAEALNEISGPTQQSIDLINQVRVAAGISNLALAGFTQQTLRDAILRERSWEFHAEGLRRQDLIRQGRFISNAVARGKAAKDFHVLFPIPQVEIGTNPNLVQNLGYGGN